MVRAFTEFKWFIPAHILDLTEVFTNQSIQDVHHQKENPERQGC